MVQKVLTAKPGRGREEAMPGVTAEQALLLQKSPPQGCATCSHGEGDFGEKGVREGEQR